MSTSSDNALIEPLTDREREVLQYLADGLSDREIGERLFLSTGTVKWHVKNIYGKLGVHKRTAAVVQGRALGLLRSDDGALVQPPVRLYHLPHPSTSFIGREEDAANILARLSDPACKLITLVGPGGVGKTRLALHCAAQLVDTFPDGVVFVALESVPSPDFLVPAIAEALQLQLTAQDDLRLQVLLALRRKNMLLVLDNFEHLLSESAYLARIAAAGPGIKLLATSREVLNLADEWQYRVEGLAVPDSADQHSVEAFGATRLFIERARRIRNDFSVSAEYPWLARICQMVSGMPLAIELLAPWLQVLTCQEIAVELERTPDMLAANRRDLPERHRSLRAVFERSWAMLTPEEQTVFMRIAVFRGGFTRHAAEYVTGASLPTLASLANKSLIAFGEGGRYQVHELSRHYAEEKLSATPEDETQTRRLHSRYYADMLQKTMCDLPDGRLLPESLQLDMDNCLAGVLYAIRQNLLEAIAAYAEGFWEYFEARDGYPAEAGLIGIYRDAIAVVEADARQPGTAAVPNPVLLRLYETLGTLLHGGRHYGEAKSAFEQALKHSPPEDRLTTARLHRKIGNAYISQRVATELVFSAFQAAELALGPEPAGGSSRWWWEWIQIQLDAVWAYYLRSEIEMMTRLVDKVADVIEQYGTLAHRSKLFANRTLLELRRHRFRNVPDEVLYYAHEALEAARQAGEERQLAWLQFSVGFVHLWRDEFELAEQHFLTALKLVEQRSGDSMGTLPTTLAYLPIIYQRRQQVDEVEKWAGAAIRVATDANAEVYNATGNAHMGWVLRRRGVLASAKQACETALMLWSRGTHFPFQWLATAPLLAIALDTGQIEQAISHARSLIDPRQQQPVGQLPDLLRQAVQQWEANEPDSARATLRTFCTQASPLGYV